MKVIELEGLDNVRDLGGIPTGDGRVVAPGIIFRGSALHGATPNDISTLFDQLGIRCVIDLRCGWELDEKPDPMVTGVENLHIPFYDLEKVGIEYTENAEGTKVVGRDVACTPSLFYRSLANPLTVGQMRAVVQTAFERATAGTPVYLHCSGGKDRAGVATLLMLKILGANREAILEDYEYTNVSRDQKYPQMLERFTRLADGDEQRGHELVVAHRAVPENLDAFNAAVCERYGSMDAFVRNQLQVSDERREELRDRCTVAE